MFRRVITHAQIVCCHGLTRSPAPHKIRDNIKKGIANWFAFSRRDCLGDNYEQWDCYDVNDWNYNRRHSPTYQKSKCLQKHPFLQLLVRTENAEAAGDVGVNERRFGKRIAAVVIEQRFVVQVIFRRTAHQVKIESYNRI